MLDRSEPAQRTLVTDRLNIVGESHTESGDRRVLERQFSEAKTLNAGYWTEAEFMNLHRPVGQRKALSGTAQDAGADLMEFRAVHGAALLIGAYEELAKDAGTMLAAPSTAAFNEFVDVRIPKFIAIRDRINRSWKPTQTEAVNLAVRNVYTAVDRVCETFVRTVTGAPAEKKLGNTKILADNITVLREFVPPLAGAVGNATPPANDAAVLAQSMRVERSKYMGLAAGLSKGGGGVWKVGNLHIVDLKSDPMKMDKSRFNILTRAEFNTELQTWQARLVK